VSVLHALKYPANSVNGVLLGSFDKDGTVHVARALPLLHSHIALAPMMDAGEGASGTGLRRSWAQGLEFRCARYHIRRRPQLLAKRASLCNQTEDCARARAVRLAQRRC